MKAARREKKKKKRPGIVSESESEIDRRLDGFECDADKGNLECDCLEIFYNIKTFLKVSAINRLEYILVLYMYDLILSVSSETLSPFFTS